jgi:putative flippase GtrA
LQEGIGVTKTPAQLTDHERLASIFHAKDRIRLSLTLISWSSEQRQLVWQFARFIAVGVANLVVSYGVYLAPLWIAPPFVAMLFASASGLVFTTILNIRYVFQRSMDPRRFLILATCYVIYTAASATSAIYWSGSSTFRGRSLQYPYFAFSCH